MINWLAILFLFTSMIMSWRVLKALRKASEDYKKLQEVSSELSYLLESSHGNLEELRFLLTQAEATLNSKIDDANLIIDDMKFISERAENIMDTLQKFINMDNRLKTAVSSILSPEIGIRDNRPQQKSSSSSFQKSTQKHFPKETSPNTYSKHHYTDASTDNHYQYTPNSYRRLHKNQERNFRIGNQKQEDKQNIQPENPSNTDKSRLNLKEIAMKLMSIH